jgi:uncharacterized protein YpuA (DUF1002 family)
MLNRFWTRALSLVLAAALLCSMGVSAFAASTSADAASDEVAGYLILGADLTDSQKTTVLKLLGVADESNYAVSTTTNAEERERFGSYLSSSVIGTRALSSILLMPAAEGSGISVTTYNINYCTEAMYQSALADAGVEDVVVYVAGPIELSGTCALASAMKAYTIMTGEELDEDAMDAAAEEIVTTGSVGEEIGDADTAAKLIAALKEKALSEDLTEEQIGKVLDQLCINMNITISSETREQIISLILKLKDADIDVDKLKEQASSLYASIKGELEKLDASGVTNNSANFFTQMIQAIINFFRSLFGGSAS